MIIKDNTYKVMKVFFDSPEESFYIRELSRITHLSPPGIIKIINNLKKEKLLKSEKTKTVENISVIKDEKFIQLKRAYNIVSVQESELVKLIREKYEEPEAVVLFGSYSKGEDTSKSDIDIAIITKKHLDIDLSSFEKILQRKISIYEIQLKDSEKEFINSLANGVIMYGYLKVLT
ncbi:MAG: nucleotidyltransferase domain-containing protein [Nanoarchaeota archaeon]|nr:nucleotidyltransferase domain-containing protein [Nanoarchaeota archaeon]